MATTTSPPRFLVNRTFRALLLAIIGSALTTISLSSQILSPIRRFQHTYGNPGTTEYSDRFPVDWNVKCCHPLERTKDGGYIMVGNKGTLNGSQILTVRTTITGSHLGADHTYVTSSLGTQGTDIHATTDGGYAILGNYYVDIPVAIDDPVFPGDIVVIKTDGTGNVIWKNRYNGTNWGGTCRDQAYSITQTKDGGYMVAGFIECPSNDENPLGFGDVLLLKLKPDGTIDWHKEYNDYHWIYVPYSVQQTSDGGYVLAGKLSKYAGGVQAFIMKVESDGTPAWCKEFGTPGTTDEFYSVAIAPDGGYIASGKMGDDIYVVKVLSDGSPGWANTYAGLGQTIDIGYDVKRNGTKYVMAGIANSSKAFLVRLHGNGAIDFAKAYAPPGANSVARSVVVADKGYAISGDVSTGNFDYYLVKTDGDGDSFCNTENLALVTTPQGDGWEIVMSTPSHDITFSDDVSADILGLNDAQLCYKEEYPQVKDATLTDVVHVHSFNHGVVVHDNGGIDDPIVEPVVLNAHAWTSEAIWVRTAQDAVISDRSNGHLYEHELINESPDFARGTNYIYVLVTNHGAQATDPGTLDVNWSVSSTNLTWPTHWDNYTSGAAGVLLGDLAGTAQIPSIGPGESYVAEIPWTTPDPDDYGGSTPSISFLARYSSVSDPITFPDGPSTEQNAINNNNIAWRNDIIVSGDDMKAAPAGGTKTIIVRNLKAEAMQADLLFRIPEEEADINPLFALGNVYVDLGPDLYQKWVQAERPGRDVEDRGDGTIKIKKDNAVIGLTLSEKTDAEVSIRFEHAGDPLPYQEYYHYDVYQAGGIGGVTFELQFPVVAAPQGGPAPKTVTQAAAKREGIAGGMLAARPNPATASTVITYRVPVLTEARLAIYDIAGNLIRVLVGGETVAAGTHSVRWDGADAAGSPVSSGTYVYRLETPLGTITRQLTVVR
jgi:FlgD Ig-like domain